MKRPSPFAAVESLSRRELEVFEGMGSAKSLRQIAAELGIAIKTTQVHRDSIRRKCGGLTTLEATRIATIWLWEQER